MTLSYKKYFILEGIISGPRFSRKHLCAMAALNACATLGSAVRIHASGDVSRFQPELRRFRRDQVSSTVRSRPTCCRWRYGEEEERAVASIGDTDLTDLWVGAFAVGR